MATELYGGTPRIRRCTTANGLPVTGSGAGIEVGCPVDAEFGTIGKTNFIQILDVAVATIRVYFTKAAFDADLTLAATDGFIELPVGAGVQFEGPVSLASGHFAQTSGARQQSQPLLYMRSTGASADAVVLFYHRRS